MKHVNSNDEIMRIQREHGGPQNCTFSQAQKQYREALYAGMTMSMLRGPEIVYDAKTDRYALKVEVAGKKHSFKTTEAVVQFVAEQLGLEGTVGGTTYFGFKLLDGVIIDAVAEVW